MLNKDPKNNQPNTNDWRTIGTYTLPEYPKGGEIIFPESIIAQFKPQEKTEEYNRYKKIMALSALQEISKSIGDIIGASGGAPIEKRDVNKTGLMAFSNYQNALKDYNDRLDRYNQLKYNLDMKAKEMNITKEQREKELDYNRDIENEKLNITTQENNKNRGFEWDIHNIPKQYRDNNNDINDWWIKFNARNNNIDIYDKENRRYNISQGKLIAMINIIEKLEGEDTDDVKTLRQHFATQNLTGIQDIVQKYFKDEKYHDLFLDVINESPHDKVFNSNWLIPQNAPKFQNSNTNPPANTNPPVSMEVIENTIKDYKNQGYSNEAIKSALIMALENLKYKYDIDKIDSLINK